MAATFSPLSLLIDVDEEPWKPEAGTLWHPADFEPERSRMVFHETLHYWQQLSQGFLVRLAEEDWDRLVAYEERGERLGPGAVRREFDRKIDGLEFSARDLHEGLARYWDVFAFGPSRLLEIEWSSRRTEVEPGVRQAFLELRRKADLPRGAWGGFDFATAMTDVAGNYALPFLLFNLALGDQFSAMCLFPLLGHFALQTSRPAAIFAKFVDVAAPKLVEHVKDVATADVPPSELLKTAINSVYLDARLECYRVAEVEGEEDGLVMGLEAYAVSSLQTHPVYRWAFAHRLLPITLRLAKSRVVVDAADRYFGGQRGRHLERGRHLVGQLILDGALATGGLAGSRRLLLVGAGLAPPCVRFSNGDTASLPEVYRQESARVSDQLRQDKLLSVLLPLMEQRQVERENRDIARTCIDVQVRWDAVTTERPPVVGKDDERGAPRERQQRLLMARARSLGEEHPDTLTAMSELAATLWAQGDLVSASGLMERVVEARLRILGEEHPDTLSAISSRAEMLRAQGELARARVLLEFAVAASRRVLGEEHPETLMAMTNLAGTLEANGELQAARGLQEWVLDASRWVLGEEHPQTLIAMSNLATTLWKQGERRAARALLTDVLAVRRRVLGDHHPDTRATEAALKVVRAR